MGMINLLPSETKKELKAAHFNVILLRYIAFLGVAIVFLVILSGASYWLLNSIKDSNNQLPGDQQSTKTIYESSKKQLDAIISNITIAKTIFDQEVSYSTIITSLAVVLPDGIVIDKLKIEDNDIGKPLTLKANAKNESLVSELRNNLAQSSIFSNTSVQSATNNQNQDYPIAIVINLTINNGGTL